MEAKRIIADGAFTQCLQENIDRFKKRPANPEKEGMRWRRSPLDSLQEKNLLTPEALRREFDMIIDKQSTLSRAERDAVRDICWDALKRASLKMQLEEQKKAEQEKSAEPPKTPRKRTKSSGRENVPDEKENAAEGK